MSTELLYERYEQTPDDPVTAAIKKANLGRWPTVRRARYGPILRPRRQTLPPEGFAGFHLVEIYGQSKDFSQMRSKIALILGIFFFLGVLIQVGRLYAYQEDGRDWWVFPLFSAGFVGSLTFVYSNYFIRHRVESIWRLRSALIGGKSPPSATVPVWQYRGGWQRADLPAAEVPNPWRVVVTEHRDMFWRPYARVIPESALMLQESHLSTFAVNLADLGELPGAQLMVPGCVPEALLPQNGHGFDIQKNLPEASAGFQELYAEAFERAQTLFPSVPWYSIRNIKPKKGVADYLPSVER